MKEVFVRKYWDEENFLFYLHFVNGDAVRQLEITSSLTKKLSIDKPVEDGSILFDKKLEDLHLEEEDFITQEEFFRIWDKKND